MISILIHSDKTWSSFCFESMESWFFCGNRQDLCG